MVIDETLAPAAMSPGRVRVLAILPYSPNRIRIRTSEALRQLTRLADLDLLILDDGGAVECPEGIRNRIVIPNASKAARAFRVLAGILTGKPISHEFYNSMRLRRVLASMDVHAYDCIYVERLPVFRYLRHPRVIYDCVDCYTHLSRLMRARGNGYKRLLYGLDAMLLPAHERAACNAASVVLVSAERERRELRRLGVTSPIEVWTHEHWVVGPPQPLRARDRFVVSFHGKLSFAANGLALRELNDVIAPALDDARYDLRIVGECPPGFPKKFPNLTFTGFVPSIIDSVRASDLSVFPLPVSVGFPNKAMESLVAGVPFIATPTVVEGLPPLDGLLERGVYVRDIPDFSSQIERYSRLSLAERQEISTACYRHAEHIYRSSSTQIQWMRLLSASFPNPVLAGEP